MFVVIFFKTAYIKTIIRFGFCDILNNQGLGKSYLPRPSARLITFTSALIIPDITKKLSNIFLFSIHTLNDLGDSRNLTDSLSRTMNSEFSLKTNFALK